LFVLLPLLLLLLLLLLLRLLLRLLLPLLPTILPASTCLGNGPLEKAISPCILVHASVAGGLIAVPQVLMNISRIIRKAELYLHGRLAFRQKDIKELGRIDMMSKKLANNSSKSAGALVFAGGGGDIGFGVAIGSAAAGGRRLSVGSTR